MSGTFVIPMESNPDVLNKFMGKIGVSNAFELVDVYGLEKDALDFLPKPTLAFILLFPCTQNYENFVKTEAAELKANPPANNDKVFYMHQYLHNACGTVALFHALLNNLDRVQLNDGPLKNFYEKAKTISPEERGKLLEQDKDIIEIHQALAVQGQTEAPAPEDEVLFHFVALTNVGGELYELDGSKKSYPISHGKTSDETFLTDAAIVAKKFMARDPNELRFSFMALSAAGEN